MTEKSITCVISARGGVWEGICLDFDIAVEGRSLEEVKHFLEIAISSYIEDAESLAEPDRSRLLSRKVPWWVEFGWAVKFLFHSLRRRARPDFEGRFALPCPV